MGLGWVNDSLSKFSHSVFLDSLEYDTPNENQFISFPTTIEWRK